MQTLPQVIGPTERALGALLDRHLRDSPISDQVAWIAMNLAAGRGEGTSLEALVDRTAKCGPQTAHATISRLIALGLLDRDRVLTPDGSSELRSVRARVRETTDSVTHGIPGEDLATTIRTLDHVKARAEARLTG